MSQPYNIAFYVHHHGSGHIMRTLAIAKSLSDTTITLIGSNLGSYAQIIPEDYSIIILPMDTPEKADLYFSDRKPNGIHYSPLNIEGQRKRVEVMTRFFVSAFPLLLVVDVSAEAAMLASLCGIPYIAVKQHGKRDDLPHLHAYGNASGILAPYPEIMKSNDPDWVLEKTFHAGGIARFEPQKDHCDREGKKVAVIIGKGGTSLTAQVIAHLAEQCPQWHFQVLGETGTMVSNYPNISFMGNLSKPGLIMENCNIIIGNAGHNTVMEVAALGKRFIVVPEERPFDEQVEKARILAALNLASIVHPEELFEVRWNTLLENTLAQEPDWTGIVSDTATAKAADYLKKIYDNNFSRSTTF
ncbi:glycosyltransferase [Pedobacter sp. 22226]|uniref:glycosyltransferase n=1 Tax=Pedobacter sp. 22226 TaxID=3453894 RepID=UPI003F838E39